jgi:Ca2+-binding EF-hand superfamily protein
MTDYAATAQKIFDQYDSDKDGNLTTMELKPFYDQLAAARADLNLTSDGFYAWFATIDLNQDGSVSLEEVTAYLASINYTA